MSRPFRWFGRDVPADGWASCPAARPAAWGLPDARPPRPRPGPLETEAALWAALGAADDADGPEVRSIVVPRAAIEEARAAFARLLGRDVSLARFLAVWRADLDVLARTAPGQPLAAPRSPTVDDVLLAGATAPEEVDELLSVDLAPSDALARPEPGGATVASGPGGISARVHAGGGCWLRRPAPFAYYAPLGPPLRGRLDPDRPASPLGAARALLDAAGPADEVLGRALAALPSAPARWRSDFWLAVLDEATPADVATGVGDDDDRVTLFAEALAGTALFAPLLAAVGERRLLDPRRAFLPAEAAGWTRADPASLPPARRAVALTLQARGLSEPWAVRLFCEARDPITGVAPLSSPAVVELVVRPLRAAVMADEPDPAAVVALLRGLEGAAGPEAVRDLLDVLLAEGAAAPSELAAVARRLRAPDAGWFARVAAGSVVASFLPAGG